MLFNLADDLGEKSDLADQYPDRVKSMTGKLEAWIAEVERDATPQPRAKVAP